MVSEQGKRDRENSVLLAKVMGWKYLTVDVG